VNAIPPHIFLTQRFLLQITEIGFSHFQIINKICK